MLQVKNLSIWYTKGKNIIDKCNFDLGKNSIIGLLGVNGAGKTTLINTISGIHKKYNVDKVLYCNNACSFAEDDFRLERYTVFSDEQAFKYWTFIEYKSYIEKVYKKKIDQEYLYYLLEGFRFGEYQNQFIKNLSTGNKKKVFLITGFALRLPLLLLDEPLDGLDFGAAEFLYTAIKEYKDFGSVLMSSHIAESFERTCDKILLLDQGKLSEKSISSNIDIRKELKEWLDDRK